MLLYGVMLLKKGDKFFFLANQTQKLVEVLKLKKTKIVMKMGRIS